MMLAEYIDHSGTDLTVVNAARCSFSKESKELNDNDRGLIKFLARGCMKKDWDDIIASLASPDSAGVDSYNEIEQTLKHIKNMPIHWAPFGHPQITLRCTVPIFVARQDFKHQVGFVRSEVSRRYVDDTPEFHTPERFRARPEGGIKQGSAGGHYDSIRWEAKYRGFCDSSQSLYEAMIEDGVAPEQARMVLPQSMLTTYWVTGSLYAWANAFIQRTDTHAQFEIRQLAAQWDSIIGTLFPISWKALTS